MQSLGFALFQVALLAAAAHAQPPGGPPPDGGGMDSGVSCPDEGNYTGDAAYIGAGPKAAPLRGAVACVDAPLTQSDGQIGSLIYGPMEAGFSTTQLSTLFGCTTADASILGGLDTLTAQLMGEVVCGINIDVLDACGGHADPYHYHERMTCLYTSAGSGHSTRIGTALDGNGIYGKYVDGGVLPTDLDACGGRTGVTPDSEGADVYYYMVQDQPPFTIGCFGPVASLAECEALYDSCGDGDEIEVDLGTYTVTYDLECPCYNSSGLHSLTRAETPTISGALPGSHALAAGVSVLSALACLLLQQ